MEPALLGDAAPARFLQRYWQKRPLLIRQAIAGFQGLLSTRELFALAARDDVESRLVWRERGRWTLAQGPFRRADFRALPERNWTLLVHGVNLHLVAADGGLVVIGAVPPADPARELELVVAVLALVADRERGHGPVHQLAHQRHVHRRIDAARQQDSEGHVGHHPPRD